MAFRGRLSRFTAVSFLAGRWPALHEQALRIVGQPLGVLEAGPDNPSGAFRLCHGIDAANIAGHIGFAAPFRLCVKEGKVLGEAIRASSRGGINSKSLPNPSHDSFRPVVRIS